MSEILPGDRRLHYSDNSHRWIAPPKVDQDAWDAGMRVHLAKHRSAAGGVFVPRQRTPRPDE